MSADVGTIVKSFLVYVRNGFFRGRAEATRSGGAYFEEYVTGIDGLLELGEERKDVFIGFTGGIQAFKARLKENPDDLGSRPFKWSEDDTSGNKRKKNWVLIVDILSALHG